MSPYYGDYALSLTAGLLSGVLCIVVTREATRDGETLSNATHFLKQAMLFLH